MTGRSCILILAAIALATVARAATSERLPRVGFCSPGIPESELVDYKHPITQSLLALMRERGWHHEKNYLLVFRTAVGRPGGMPACVESLVREPVDVIVVPGEALEISKLTGHIPVVGGIEARAADMPAVRDPRRNFTGVMRDTSDDLWRKRIAIFKEVAKVDRIVVLTPWKAAPDVHAGLQREKTGEMREAENAVGVDLDRWSLTSMDQIEHACATIAARPRSGILVSDSPMWVTWEKARPADVLERSCVQRHRLPVMYSGIAGFSVPGVLMGYGPSYGGTMRLLPYFIDRILKGARPGDLPVSAAEDYQLGLNLDVAKQLGITFPSAILLRADMVFEDGRLKGDSSKPKSPY